MGIRMRFGPGDDAAYPTRRDELGEQFADWLNTRGVTDVDPNDAGLLMDWKHGYADGALDRWQVADVEEFLFDWCTRKLSATPEDCAGIPASVAAFVEFLAHQRLLAGGDPPSRIRAYCDSSRDRFVREMGDPANFGMAKGLFASVGGLEPSAVESAGDLDALMARMTGLPSEALDDLAEPVGHGPPRLGPLRVPDDEAVRASAAAAPMLVAMRELASYCTDPGIALTAKGNLRLADARRLVDLLDTGDDPGPRSLRSAEQLPVLSWYVHLGLEIGAVRRLRGRLVAVARYAGLDDGTAYEKLVRVALDTAPPTSPLRVAAAFTPAVDALDDCLLLHLFELTDGPADVDDLVDMVDRVAGPRLGGLPSIFPDIVDESVEAHLRQLVALGLVRVVGRKTVSCADCDELHARGGYAELTPIGVHTAVSLAREGGLEVVERPDPATADAVAIIDLAGEIDEQEWLHDVGEWFAARPDPATAAAELACAAFDERRPTIIAMAGLQALQEIAGDHVVTAVRPHLEGPHDGVLINWMVEHADLDPATIEPARLIRGFVDALAGLLDGGGPAEVVAAIGGDQQESLSMLSEIWRLDHPRLVELLDALGTHHPSKTVAKAARKALIQHRSFLAEQRAGDGTGPGTRKRRKR